MKNLTVSAGFFFVLSYLLLKDMIKISSYYLGFDLNYILAPVLLFVVIYFILSVNSMRLISPILIYFIYFFYSLLSLMLLMVFNDVFAYSLRDIIFTWYYQFAIGFSLVLFALLDPVLFKKVFHQVWRFIFSLVSFSLIVYLVFYFVDESVLTATFMLWMKAGLIVNPLQTSESAIQLRFSSIFYSAYTLALFATFSCIYMYFRYDDKLKLFLVYFISAVLVFLTFNRNGYFLFCLASISILSHMLSRKLFSYLNVIYLISFLALSVFLPFFLIYANYDFLSNVYSFDGVGVLSKISTLMVRFFAWNSYFDSMSLFDFIFGIGLVQGVAGSSMFMDNGLYYILAQTGFLSLLLFCGFMISLFSCNYNLLVINENNRDASMSCLFISIGMFSSFLNISIHEVVFTLFVVSYPLVSILLADMGGD